MTTFRHIIAIICASAAMLGARGQVLTSDAAGWLERGKQMYESGNYIGALDQLHHVKKLAYDATTIEEARYYIAMSLYECGRRTSVAHLRSFVEEYPTSAYAPHARVAIGDYFFYCGKFAQAADEYQLCILDRLDSECANDVRYRHAYALLRQGKIAEARTRMDSLAKTKRYRSAAQFYQAYVAYTEGRYAAAYEGFSQITGNEQLRMLSDYYICQIHFAQQNYESAATLGAKLLGRTQPEVSGISFVKEELIRVVGESCFRQGNRTEAERYLKEYVSIAPEVSASRTATYAYGTLLYDRGETEQCVALMRRVAQADDALSQSAYYYMGQAYRSQGDKNTAAIAYQKAMTLDFDSDVTEAATYNYAVCQAQGSGTPFNRSIDLFEQFVNRYPESAYRPQVEEYLVDAYINTNDYDRALQSISHIAKPSDKVLKAKQIVLYNLGARQLSESNLTAAANSFTQAIAVGRYDAEIADECRLWLAECRYKQGKYSDAESNYRTYLKSRRSGGNSAVANYGLGYALFQQRRYSDAVAPLKKASESSALGAERLADAHYRLADCYYYNRRYSDAAAEYDKAYNANRAAGDYALYQKALLLGATKQYQAKASQLDRMLKEYPSSALVPAALLEKANTYATLGDNSKALATYAQLAKNHAGSPEARKALLQSAITRRNMHDNSGAIADYKQVVSKYPSSDEASVAVEDLKLIYAEMDQLGSLAEFLNGVPGAPRINVAEFERLAFESAEKGVLSTPPSYAKMESYLKQYPNGAYSAQAHYHMAKNYFAKGEFATSKSHLDKALAGGADAPFTTDALAMKGHILHTQGDAAGAVEVYATMAQKADDSDTKTVAYLGMMRAAKDGADWKKLLTAARVLASMPGLTDDEDRETAFCTALAQQMLGNASQAENGYARLATEPATLYGAQSAYRLALMQYESGNDDGAADTVNALIDSNTPQHYWLAKAFILLADIYHKQGRNFEAREYLESLKNNYPGKESDIFSDINSRLNAWKK